jgi:hypothetical protein
MIVFVLEQYDDRACKDGVFNPGLWVKAFEKSRTGKRVKKLSNGIPFKVVNSTTKNIKSHIKRHRPNVVVICGKRAKRVTRNMELNRATTIWMPHPAWRQMTNEMISCYRRHILRAMLRSF